MRELYDKLYEIEYLEIHFIFLFALSASFPSFHSTRRVERLLLPPLGIKGAGKKYFRSRLAIWSDLIFNFPNFFHLPSPMASSYLGVEATCKNVSKTPDGGHILTAEASHEGWPCMIMQRYVKALLPPGEHGV